MIWSCLASLNTSAVIANVNGESGVASDNDGGPISARRSMMGPRKPRSTAALGPSSKRMMHTYFINQVMTNTELQDGGEVYPLSITSDSWKRMARYKGNR